MTASVRGIFIRRLAVALVIAGGAASAPASPAQAQAAPAPAPDVPASEFPTPVELTINVVNGQVVCQSQTLRLPARDLIALHVINKSTLPILFLAPDFFHASQGMQTDGVRYNPEKGGFLVQRNSTLAVTLRTPPAGEYYYACNYPGEVSTIWGTGFIVIVPEPDTSGGQALPRR